MATKNETASSVSKVASRFGEIAMIPGVRTDVVRVLVIGTAPIITHFFPQKARDKVLAKHMGEASEGREKKDPIANFEGARYRTADAGDGVPAGGLKACIVKGFSKASGVPMTQAKGSIRVQADCVSTNLVRLLTPIEPEEVAERPHFVGELGRVPRCREDVVRNDSGVIDIRHRPEYWPWAMLLAIEFLPSVCSDRQLLQAVAMAGFKEGLCEWRPGSKESLSGTYGTFRIATEAEIRALEDNSLFSDFKWPQVTPSKKRKAPALVAAE